ncbi:MAG: carbohydrate kinase family protein [Promethearchaeota archaeon]|nr:MAG: carbohydrate kinase family protein [Candidatus Lokiarchaeota archaeon]
MTVKFDVICIGAALVDMVAQVERHPLDDDEVFVSDLQLLSGGAAANTAYACAKIGLSSAFLGKLGTNDIFGIKIMEDFNKVKVNTTLIKYSKDYGTGSAYVAINIEGDRRIYAHSGAANYLSKEDVIEQEIKTSKIIFLSSLKNLEPFIEAAKLGKKNGIPVILNPGMLIIDQGLDNILELLKNIDIFILSHREFTTLLHIKEKLEEKKLREKANVLLSYGIKALIITMGEKGAFLISNNNSELIPSMKIEDVIDTTGAGDAFSAGFIYGFAKNLNFEFSNLKTNVKLGNFVAGKCVQQLGARNGIPTYEEVKQIFLP